MKSRAAEKELRRYLDKKGISVPPPAPRDGVLAMLGFYRDVRASDVDLDRDGDMLLFQWGVYDSGQGARFELDITRQFIRAAGRDEDFWQLHLTYRFPPAADLAALGKGDKWCHSPSEVAGYEAFVLHHPALAATDGRRDASCELSYECAG